MIDAGYDGRKSYWSGPSARAGLTRWRCRRRSG